MSDSKEGKRRKMNAVSSSAIEEETTEEPTSKEVHEPEDVAVIKNILESMGVVKYEPRVISQLLEFVHRYTTNVLVDAQEYSHYASKPEMDQDDIRLAAMSRLHHTYSQMPPRELMMELAEKRNAIPLPPIPNEYGVRLPSPEYQISTDHIPYISTHRMHPPTSMNSTPSMTPMTHHSMPSPASRGSRNIKFSAAPIPIRIKSGYP
ncbi:hypothetical protein THRCLA_21382 [Thraustotheca clavata]|uniref:Transcription initiation factor TFIID subunit 9 n=1 Tax=Thraustotheca clavata TaxID=74557 RepID=A0A1V9ZX43_9STRA|nr:hypothetical protein THRCLA_21382 [Thraustotheca clavata]